MIDRVASALGQVADELLLIANDPLASAWLPGVRTESDLRPGVGSLGGIHAAVVHSRGPALVVAWDMPFVPAELLAALVDLGRSADAAVPESDSRRGLEPLCAYYTPACIAPIERRLQEGDLRVVGFYSEIRLARLHAEQVRLFGDPAHIFMNVNSPDDLQRAEMYASSTNGGRHRQEA